MICLNCGKEFIPLTYRNKLCSEECKRERIKEQKSRKKKKPNEDIVDISVKAKEMGMSYGQYQAMQYMKHMKGQ